jgi:hypothetical protein
MTRVTIGKSIPSWCLPSVQCRLGQSVIRVISRNLPTASRRRRVGHGAVALAIGPRDNRTAAKVEIRASRIAARPAANPRGERTDLFGGGHVWVGEGGCLDGRQGGLFRRRLAEEGSGQLGFGVAVGLDGDGGLFDLGNRHCTRGQEADHNGNSARDAALAVLPASNAPWADAEQRGETVLCDSESAECRTEFGRGPCPVARSVNGHDACVVTGLCDRQRGAPGAGFDRARD